MPKTLMIIIALNLLSVACAASLRGNRARSRRIVRSIDIRTLTHVITQLNPQAQRRGWNWRKEYPRYYRPTQLNRYARWLLITSKKYDQDPLYMAAILQEQSRFQYDAQSPTRDFGMAQINCGRSSPWCRYPPTREQKKKLLNPKWSIETLGKWLVRKQFVCTRARRGSKLYKRCLLNKRLTGVIGTMYHPHKTRRILRRIRSILAVYRIPAS